MSLLRPMKKQDFGIVIVGLACLFSLAFSAISILSAYELNRGVFILVNHPIKVSAAIYKMHNAVSNMETYIGRLTNYNAPSDVDIVRDKIIALKPQVEEDLNYIINYYLGPKEEARYISGMLQELYAAQEQLMDEASSISRTEIVVTIEKKLTPLYKSMGDTFTDKMLVFISGTGERLLNQSQTTLNLNVLFSVLLSLLVVVFAVVMYRIEFKRSEERRHRDFILKVISENAGNVFMLYALKTRKMEYISPNILTMLGAEPRLIEEHAEQLLDYCDVDHVGHLAALFGSDPIRTITTDECLFRNPVTGEVRWMLVSIYPVRERGAVVRNIISISDLTEIRKNQQTLRDALVNAQNANMAKSQFFARMSHDIRTPMNAIIGMTTIAATALEDRARVQDCLAKISSSSRHLLMLINDVLDMSKIESGKFTIARTPFELSTLIRDVTSIIYPQALAKDLHFEIAMDNVTHEKLIGDPLRLNQVLLNILSNALKFTPKSGTIRMRLKERPDRRGNRIWLYFNITDSGVGMTPEFLERLFQPFEQEHSSMVPQTTGTGLGMAITKNIVSLMNGTLTVQSTLGSGTTFDVGLSFEIGEGEAEQRKVEFDELKVLVVDDDKDTCEHTSLILDRMGIKAEWVLSGSEAVVRVVSLHERGEGFDVVFIDWKMPEMDGLEVTRRIRRHVGPETLIIIISAYDWTEIESEAHEAGANAFITKPMFQSNIYNTLLGVTKGFPVASQDCNEPPNFSGKRFLLVEDNELNSEIAIEFLKVTGAEIDAVDNGEKAVRAFAESMPGTYSAILMDVQMPVMDGYQATRRIRKLEHPDARDIFILAMTANAFDDDVATALQSGMNDHIGKPLDIELLFQKLQKGHVERVV